MRYCLGSRHTTTLTEREEWISGSNTLYTPLHSIGFEAGIWNQFHTLWVRIHTKMYIFLVNIMADDSTDENILI